MSSEFYLKHFVILEAFMDTLSNEIVLLIIEHIPYEEGIFRNLQLVDRLWRDLIKRHLCSLALNTGRRQYSTACISLTTPSDRNADNFKTSLHRWLTLLSYHQSVANVILRAMNQVYSDCPDSAYNLGPKVRSFQLFNAGIHLLFRMQGCQTKQEKAEYLETIPLTSLCIIYLTTAWSGRTYLGLFPWLPGNPDPSHLVRCFSECVLEVGPDFIQRIFSLEDEPQDVVLARLMLETIKLRERQSIVQGRKRSLHRVLKRQIAGQLGCDAKGSFDAAVAFVQDTTIP